MADAKTEKQKVKEITDKLEEGLKELFESEKYKSYLSTMSKFHNYSFNNTLLIAIQKPEATLLHDKEVNKDILAPAKDRNTKEVEAESIAYTVCQHFGIDTSEYSYGYITGWSTGRDVKELKSSLDTIRRIASELITGIEEQLKELQRDREIMQEQEKESLLLIQNSDLSEYSLVNVRGMDVAEIANEGTREFGEYHLDVRYITDTNEIIDLKTERESNERAKEPNGADDVILKIAYSDGFEVERIANKTPEEVQEIMGALTKLEVVDRKNIHDCLESYGADYIPIIVSGGRNLMDFPMRRLSENEKKWQKTKIKDDCPEVADMAREIYNVCFPYAERNAIKKQLVINTLSFGVHTEVYDEYGDMELVDRHFTIDRKSRVLTMTDFQTEGVEQSVTLEGGQMAKLLRYIVHTLEIFMWEEDYSRRPDEGDYDPFFNGEEDFFMEDLKDGLEVQPIKEPEGSPSWWVQVEYTNHTEQDICSYEDYLSDRPEELYLSLLEYFEPEDEVF